MIGRARIGTSGFVYAHWRGLFYPRNLRTKDWLPFYMKQFDTVEINSTFYRLPEKEAFMHWESAAPEGFVYAVKAGRFITHLKKLKEPGKSLKVFMERASFLKDTMGPILFQLPPNWGRNTERLEEFVESLPPSRRFAFEFRDSSWFNEEVYAILRKRGIALCIYHMVDFTTPFEVTAPFVYLRFHGAGALYGGRYNRSFLREWADLIRGYLKKGLDVYAYFNNDEAAYAAVNAKELREMAG